MSARLILPAILFASLAGGLAIAAAGPQTIAQATRESAEAARRAAQFNREAAKAGDEAARARARSEALVAEIQKIEADISLAQARIAHAEADLAARRARLAERQQPVMRLTSALQTMARRPPALALVQPGSIDEIVRVRALLASTLPAVRERTAGLRADLAASARLRAEAGGHAAALAASRDALRRKRVELARLEQEELRRSQDLAGAALFETDRAVAFSEEAGELAAEMRSADSQKRVRGRLSELPSPLLRPGGNAPARRPHRPAPYRLPVEGQLVTGTGEISDSGVHARGLTFRTAADAPVVAPRSGKIAYAGRFRSYGEIVVIDHGGGWTSTITDLAALRVRQGDLVKTGAPIGRTRGRIMVELRHNGRPASIAALIAPG